jgi:hypothetical protein
MKYVVLLCLLMPSLLFAQSQEIDSTMIGLQVYDSSDSAIVQIKPDIHVKGIHDKTVTSFEMIAACSGILCWDYIKRSNDMEKASGKSTTESVRTQYFGMAFGMIGIYAIYMALK